MKMMVINRENVSYLWLLITVFSRKVYIQVYLKHDKIASCLSLSNDTNICKNVNVETFKCTECWQWILIKK